MSDRSAPREGGIAHSYLLMKPPGFVHVPGGVQAEVALDAVVRQLGDAEVTPEFENAFGAALSSVVEADGAGVVLDSFVTAGPLQETGMTASIVVASVPVRDGSDADLDRLLLGRVTRGADALAVGGEPAVAWDDEPPSQPRAGAQPNGRVLRRRTALSRVTGADDVLVSLVLMVVEAREVGLDQGVTRQIADALVELFDAVLTTVRWVDDHGRVLSDRHTPSTTCTSPTTREEDDDHRHA